MNTLNPFIMQGIKGVLVEALLILFLPLEKIIQSILLIPCIMQLPGVERTLFYKMSHLYFYYYLYNTQSLKIPRGKKYLTMYS